MNNIAVYFCPSMESIVIYDWSSLGAQKQLDDDGREFLVDQYDFMFTAFSFTYLGAL